MYIGVIEHRENLPLGGDRWGNKSRSALKRLNEGYFSSGADDTFIFTDGEPRGFSGFSGASGHHL